MKSVVLAVALSGCAVFSVQATETAISLVPYANQRIWQTVFDASKPLEWRWTEGAAKATVTVADLVSGTVAAPVTVTRAGDALYGSFSVPTPTASADSGERLVDVTLVQLDAGEAALETKTARLAYLPDSITVDKPGARFGKLSAPRPVAYDNAWTDAAAATGAAYAFVPADGPRVDRDLGATSGWFVQPAETGALTVSFTGAAGVLSADILLKPGFLLFLR